MSLRTFRLALVSASVAFSGCNCDDVLGALPTPVAVLFSGTNETPPLEIIEVGLPPVALNTAAPIEVQLRNDGNADLVVSDVILSSDPVLCPSPSAAFAITEPADVPRAFTLPENQQRAIRLTFTPTSGQPSCAVVEVRSNDAVSPVLRALITGQGDAPQLCADRAIVDFGEVFVGESKDDVVTVTSCGTRPITITGSTLNAQFPDPFTAGAIPTGTPLAPGASLDVPVTFAPLVQSSWSVSNGTSGTIALTTDAPVAGEYRIDLVGTSRRPPSCVMQVVPSVVQFGTVGAGRSSTQTVFIKNIGELDCTFTSADVRAPEGSFSRVLIDLVGGDVLSAQQTGTVTVTFAPPVIAGTENGFLDVVTSDPVTPNLAVPLEGTSVEVTPCFLEATPTALNFGVQAPNHSDERIVTFTNVGAENCLISDQLLVSGAPEFSILEGPLPVSFVTNGGTIDVIVSFRPVSPGNKTGIARIEYHEFGFGNPDQTIDVPLSGQALAPCISVTPLDIDYGSVSPGATADRDVVISNCGGVDLNIRGVSLRSGSHPDFLIQAMPVQPSVIAAGAAETVTVRAAPTNLNVTLAGVAMFGTLEVLSDVSPQHVNLRANSGACTQGIVCQPQSIAFGEVNVGETLVRSLICTNPGTTTVTIAPSVTPAGAPFQIVSAPASIAAGQQGVIRVEYTATTATSATGSIALGANTCSGAPANVPVSGAGVDDQLPPCPTPQAFSPQALWEWDGSSDTPASKQVWVTPLVARLEDTDGDNIVTRQDMPRVVFVTFDHDDFPSIIDGGSGSIDSANDAMPGILRAIDGATGGEVWSASNLAHRVNSAVTPAIVDLDGDGCVEIIASKFVVLPGVEVIPNGPKIAGKFARGNLLAFDCLGNFKWESDEWTRSVNELEDMGGPAVGDVDGDGFAEVALGDHLFDHNGHLLWRGGRGTGSAGHGPLSVLVDVDNQPGLELVAGATVYRADGSVLWDHLDDVQFDGMPAVADLDNDGDNEVVLRSGEVWIFDGATGAVINGPLIPPTRAAMGTICSPTGADDQDECNIIPTNPAIMNVDGGNDLEIAIASEEILICYDNQLDEMWRGPVSDSTGASGPVGFDFENDGTDNVVYSDEGHVWSWGATGNEIYDTERASVTLFEYASIADVDLDGHANILVGSNEPLLGSSDGLDAWQNTGTSWAHARAIWNQHAYVEALVSELGTPLPQQGPLDGFRTATPQCVD